LAVAQAFVHENRIRQAASSLGAAVFCIEESVKYARRRKPFGKDLSSNQAIQFPLVELATQAEMLRLLVRETAWKMDRMPHQEIEKTLSDKVSMCNYWANRLCTESADRAIQVGSFFKSRTTRVDTEDYRYTVEWGIAGINPLNISIGIIGGIGSRKDRKRSRCGKLQHTCLGT